jgi:hypothetical protein
MAATSARKIPPMVIIRKRNGENRLEMPSDPAGGMFETDNFTQFIEISLVALR